MLYVDFGKDVVVRTVAGPIRFKRYTAFKNARSLRDVPTIVMHKAQTMIAESLDGSKVWWQKNQCKEVPKTLTAGELKQFLFQKLASEIR